MPEDPRTQDDYGRGGKTVSLDGYYVIRGYNEGHDFSSTLDIPKEESIALMEKIHPFRGKGPADENGHRDQGVYYADRKATDDWLREQAGVKGDRENPVFFTVTKDPEKLLQLMGGRPGGYTHYMVVPVAALDTKKWSFTVDDSMGNFFSRDGSDVNENTGNFLHDSNPEHGKVKNVKEIIEAIEKYPTTPNGMPRQFEAQFWGPKFDPLELGGQVVKGEDIAPKKSLESAIMKGSPKTSEVGTVAKAAPVAHKPPRL